MSQKTENLIEKCPRKCPKGEKILPKIYQSTKNIIKKCPGGREALTKVSRRAGNMTESVLENRTHNEKCLPGQKTLKVSRRTQSIRRRVREDRKYHQKCFQKQKTSSKLSWRTPPWGVTLTRWRGLKRGRRLHLHWWLACWWRVRCPSVPWTKRSPFITGRGGLLVMLVVPSRLSPWVGT